MHRNGRDHMAISTRLLILITNLYGGKCIHCCVANLSLKAIHSLAGIHLNWLFQIILKTIGRY